jgi:hypothetical protein
MFAYRLRASFRRRLLLAMTASLIVAALVAAWVWHSLPHPLSVASVILRIPEQPEVVLFPHPEGNGGADEAKRKKLDDLAAKHEDLVATYEEKRKELEQLEDRLAKLVVRQIYQRANKPKDLEAIQVLAQIRKSENELSEIDAALLGLNLDLYCERVKREVELEDRPRVKLLEPATIEHVNDFPRLLRLSLLAGLGAFAATMLGFALLGRLRDRKGNEPDAGYSPA